MINFDEELEKFKPIMEIEQAEIIIRNQNLEDMADVALGIIAEARDEAVRTANLGVQGAVFQNIAQPVPQDFEVPDALL